jgi:hypothetical protein
MSVIELIFEDDTAAMVALVLAVGWGVCNYFGYSIPFMQFIQ